MTSLDGLCTTLHTDSLFEVYVKLFDYQSPDLQIIHPTFHTDSLFEVCVKLFNYHSPDLQIMHQHKHVVNPLFSEL